MNEEELVMTKKLLLRMFKQMEELAESQKTVNHRTFTQAALMHSWRKDLAAIIHTMSKKQ